MWQVLSLHETITAYRSVYYIGTIVPMVIILLGHIIKPAPARPVRPKAQKEQWGRKITYLNPLLNYRVPYCFTLPWFLTICNIFFWRSIFFYLLRLYLSLFLRISFLCFNQHNQYSDLVVKYMNPWNLPFRRKENCGITIHCPMIISIMKWQ